MAETKRKYPSGASKRKAKKEQLEGLIAAHAAIVPDDPVLALAKARVQELGPPPSDPIEHVRWAGHLGAIVAWLVAINPESTALRLWASSLKGMIDAIGKTAVKAKYEADLKRTIARVRKSAPAEDDGTVPITGGSTPGTGGDGGGGGEVDRPVPDSATEAPSVGTAGGDGVEGGGEVGPIARLLRGAG